MGTKGRLELERERKKKWRQRVIINDFKELPAKGNKEIGQAFRGTGVKGRLFLKIREIATCLYADGNFIIERGNDDDVWRRGEMESRWKHGYVI